MDCRNENSLRRRRNHPGTPLVSSVRWIWRENLRHTTRKDGCLPAHTRRSSAGGPVWSPALSSGLINRFGEYGGIVLWQGLLLHQLPFANKSVTFPRVSRCTHRMRVASPACWVGLASRGNCLRPVFSCLRRGGLLCSPSRRMTPCGAVSPMLRTSAGVSQSSFIQQPIPIEL